MSQSQMDALARRIRDDAVVNVYCVREIAGAHGKAKPLVESKDPGDYAALADRDESSASDPSRRFQLSLVTLAHELGHLLGLPHMPDYDNCLHTWSNPGAVRISVPQKRIARKRAEIALARQGLALPVSDILHRLLARPGLWPAPEWRFDPER